MLGRSAGADCQRGMPGRGGSTGAGRAYDPAPMDSRAFLGLQRSHNPYRWHLEVTPGLATAGNFLFGGCGLGAAISAMEGTTGRPCVWATAQYLSFARTGEVMDIDVTVAVDGHQISQAAPSATSATGRSSP